MIFFIASRIFSKSLGIRNSGWISYLAILGISFSVMVSILVMSVLTGFEKAYEKSLLGFNSHLVIFVDPEIESNSQKLLLDMESSLQGVLEEGEEFHLSPFIFKQAISVQAGKIKTLNLKGIHIEKLKEVYDVDIKEIEEIKKSKNIPEIFVGKSFYENQINSKKEIQLWLPSSESSRLKKNFQKFRIKGVFHSGLHEFDDGFALIDYNSLSKLLKSEPVPLGVEVKLFDYLKAPDIALKLKQTLSKNYEIIPWNQLNHSLFEAMKLEKITFITIMGLIILISCFNIMGVCLLAFLKEMKTFFLLHCLGLNWNSIKKTIYLLGSFYGVMGAGLGIISANFILWSLNQWNWFSLDPEVYFIDSIPVHFSILRDVLLCVGVVFICLFVSRFSFTQMNQSKSNLLLRKK